MCLGHPGTLPVLNREAFTKSHRVALAFAGDVRTETEFDRKNYYYPDLPKNYQISQNGCNLGVDGCLEISADGGTLRVGISNVHLEEDAGKNLHTEAPGADYSLVDLNRAGVPLLEIVSAPDMHSVEQADAYMQALLPEKDVFEVRYVPKKSWQEKFGMAAEAAAERTVMRLWQAGTTRRLP